MRRRVGWGGCRVGESGGGGRDWQLETSFVLSNRHPPASAANPPASPPPPTSSSLPPPSPSPPPPPSSTPPPLPSPPSSPTSSLNPLSSASTFTVSSLLASSAAAATRSSAALAAATALSRSPSPSRARSAHREASVAAARASRDACSRACARSASRRASSARRWASRRRSWETVVVRSDECGGAAGVVEVEERGWGMALTGVEGMGGGFFFFFFFWRDVRGEGRGMGGGAEVGGWGMVGWRGGGEVTVMGFSTKTCWLGWTPGAKTQILFDEPRHPSVQDIPSRISFSSRPSSPPIHAFSVK